jgi:hypothetical protein
MIPRYHKPSLSDPFLMCCPRKGCERHFFSPKVGFRVPKCPEHKTELQLVTDQAEMDKIVRGGQLILR